VPITLRWRARAPIAERYTVFIHVIDPSEYLWGQHDGEPGGGARSTNGWLPGEDIFDRHGLPILAGTPPGEYQIEIGLYDSGSGARLPVLDAAGQPRGDRL